MGEGEGAVSFFDLTGWTVLTLRGRDCVKFLNNFCTADVKKLAAGEGAEAFFTNVKARVVGHGIVLAGESAGEAVLTVVGTPGQGEKLAAHLDRYLISEQVTIEDATARSGVFYVAGPEAGERMRAAGLEPPGEGADGERFPWTRSRLGDTECAVARIDASGLPGYLVVAANDQARGEAEVLMRAGAAAGSAEAFEALRVEACFPLYGVDVTEEQLAPEAGRPWAISYTKGCYLGQEPIARIDALGHVNRLLCGLRLDGEAMPERGAAIVAEGKEVGSVTSAARGSDGPVVMGYVRAKLAEAGSPVGVRVGEGEVGATVVRAGRAP